MCEHAIERIINFLYCENVRIAHCMYIIAKKMRDDIMMDAKQKNAAKKFAADWKGKGYEKGQSQTFWLTLLSDVLGVENVGNFITFEEQVKLDHASFIDGIIPSTHVLIEQKSVDKNLKAAIKQSDGSLLSPFQHSLVNSRLCCAHLWRYTAHCKLAMPVLR